MKTPPGRRASSWRSALRIRRSTRRVPCLARCDPAPTRSCRAAALRRPVRDGTDRQQRTAAASVGGGGHRMPLWQEEPSRSSRVGLWRAVIFLWIEAVRYSVCRSRVVRADPRLEAVAHGLFAFAGIGDHFGAMDDADVGVEVRGHAVRDTGGLPPIASSRRLGRRPPPPSHCSRLRDGRAEKPSPVRLRSMLLWSTLLPGSQ